MGTQKTGVGSPHGLAISLERAGTNEARPVLESVFRAALRRYIEGGGDLTKKKEFLNGAERSIVAAVIVQVSAIPELIGRLKARSEAAIQGGRGWLNLSGPNSPDDPARLLNPDEAVQLTPEEAVRYFNMLSPQRRTPLPDTWLERHRRSAFTMAATTDETALTRVHGLIRDELEKGGTVDKSGAAIDKILEGLGVTPKNPQYAEMVARTNVMDAYADGYYREVRDDPNLAEAFPFWEYMAIEDDRLRDEHRDHLTEGIGGTAFFPADESFDRVRGDNVYNCRCQPRWIHYTEARTIPELAAAMEENK